MTKATFHDLPADVVGAIVKTYLPNPDTYCILKPAHGNPNKTRAVSRDLKLANGPKCDAPCKRVIFHYSKNPVLCSVCTDDAVLESMRTMDYGAASALEELRRHQSPIYGPQPYVAYIHILERDMETLGSRWYHELALPDNVVISGTCCDGAGVGIQLR